MTNVLVTSEVGFTSGPGEAHLGRRGSYRRYYKKEYSVEMNVDCHADAEHLPSRDVRRELWSKKRKAYGGTYRKKRTAHCPHRAVADSRRPVSCGHPVPGNSMILSWQRAESHDAKCETVEISVGKTFSMACSANRKHRPRIDWMAGWPDGRCEKAGLRSSSIQLSASCKKVGIPPRYI